VNDRRELPRNGIDALPDAVLAQAVRGLLAQPGARSGDFG
jgi:hypothetical protein